jgi:hypothetical protein
VAYLSIPNLYKNPDLLNCYALEKVHGTSAHISWKANELKFFSGGESYSNFVALFDSDFLLSKFADLFLSTDDVTVFGEAFGGKQQGMSEVYGKRLRFVAFDVKVNDTWLNVPSAATVVESLGLTFVPYEMGPLTLEWLDEQRDKPSLVAVVPDAIREGVVIRPIYEAKTNNGERVIVKHKRDEFRETKTPRIVDHNRMVVLTAAKEVADEWVTPMRLQHVLQKTPFETASDTGKVIRAMIEDVKRESDGEVVWSKDVEKAIGKATACLLHKPVGAM